MSKCGFAVECAAARMSHERATAEGVAELTDLCAAIDRPELPYVDSLKTDFAFHRKIVGLTGNILMQNVMEVLQPFVVAGMVHTTPQPRDYGHSRRHHEQILNAIRDGNADEAEAAMKRHMVLQLCRLPLNVRDIASADRGDVKIIEQLYKQAHESEKSIKTRLGAVNNLGEIAKSPNEVEVLETIKEKLKGLLNNPNVQPDEENGFLAAVVGAIADLGPNGRELLPHLASARGRFAEVDAAIALAETSILHSPQSRANADAPNELTDQAAILNDLHKPVHHRLAAAKFFGDDMIINKYAQTLGQVIEPVLKAMKRDPDFDVRRVAAESANRALEALRDKPATINFKNWTQQYISGLASMLATSKRDRNPNATNLRIFAATALGDLAGDFEKYPEEFLVLANLIRAANPSVEPSPYVNSVAQKALDKIAGKDDPKW